MKIINLDENFKPFGEGIRFEKFDFPSGCEPHIKLSSVDIEESYFQIYNRQRPVFEKKTREIFKITCRIQNANDLILLLLTVDALKRSGIKRIGCFMPYLPFARQDRVMVKGEPLSVKVIADLINSQGFEEVQIYDVHSEVSLALINNCKSVTNHLFVEEVLKDKKDYLIISPDAGAYKKIFKVCQHLKYQDEIIMCNKIRDVTNGVIRSLTVSHEDLKGKDCYIIDDICDGGGTFILLASVLKERNAGKVNLIVSHGIFSKGVSALANIDHIYTTDSFKDLEPSNKLTQIKLCNIHI